ncbi:TnpV protein [Oscillibacter sp.]|uniref:TnpV protein n=1 Tax=Oscillibacter sp. TaxID=1945593 RepID=UPI003398076F
MEITYHEQDGVRIPDLLMPQQPDVHLGKYAELRRQYLMKHRRVLYANLLTSCELTEHLAWVEKQALEMVDQLTQQMAKAEGVTEELKAKDQMRWVGLMNNFKHSAEEQVLSDLIYA